MTSGAMSAALKELTPAFERASGSTLVIVSGGSVAGAPDSIPDRLQRGERADVVIMAATASTTLIKAGRVVPGSRADLARSSIGLAVRAGAPKPDISTVDALQARAASGGVGRLFLERQRRLHLDRALSAPRHRRPDADEEPEDRERAGRRGRRARRGRDGVPADQRAAADARARRRRTAARRRPARHRVLRRRRRRIAPTPPAAAR